MVLVFIFDGLVNFYLIKVFVNYLDEINEIFDFILYNKVCFCFFLFVIVVVGDVSVYIYRSYSVFSKCVYDFKICLCYLF